MAGAGTTCAVVVIKKCDTIAYTYSTAESDVGADKEWVKHFCVLALEMTAQGGPSTFA